MALGSRVAKPAPLHPKFTESHDMTTDTTASLVAAHRHATRALLQAGMAQFKQEHPEEYRTATRAAQSGGQFVVTAALAPSGLDELFIDLVTASGQRINLMHVENMPAGAG